MPTTPPSNRSSWGKKKSKQGGLSNTPADLDSDYFTLPLNRSSGTVSPGSISDNNNANSHLSPNMNTRPQYRRSRSSSSMLKFGGQQSPTIPENNPVDHLSDIPLPTFKPISNDGNDLSKDKRRRRADSVVRDANITLSKNIVGNDDDEDDLPDDDEDEQHHNEKVEEEEEEEADNDVSEKDELKEEKPETLKKAKVVHGLNDESPKRKVEFYNPQESLTTSSSENKLEKSNKTFEEEEHTKEHANSHSTTNEDIVSVNSDSRAGNILTRLLNFKHKSPVKDDESIIENPEPSISNTNQKRHLHGITNLLHIPTENNFELELFSEDHPSRYIKKDQVNNSDGDISDEEEQEEEVRQEVNNIIQAHEPTRLSKFLHKRSKSNASTGNLSRSSSKTSLSDFFYTQNDNGKDGLEIDDQMKQSMGNDEYIPPPTRVQEGVLGSLMKIYALPQYSESSATMLDGASTSTGAQQRFHNRKSSLDNLSEGVTSTLSPNAAGSSSFIDMPSFKPSMTKQKKASLSKHNKKLKAKITVHLESIGNKKKFIINICTALMLYGAPPHRLEEYMLMTSRVLELDAQFMYFPGCMIVAFNDPTTKTTDMQLVRTREGVNLSKLHDTHQIYKAVIHDIIGSEEAAKKLENLMNCKVLYPPWLLVLFYGFGSAMVCPFAFDGRWVDMPICFLIGCCVGFLQFYVSPRSVMYSNVFEVSASIVVSFLGRAIGSIDGGKLFCFSAIVQGSLALILPGFIILTGSLELQSRNIINGAVRMVYAIIYSLFLSFGITIGAALYGWIDHNATSNQTCVYHESLSPWFRFIFVPMFSLILAVINQASWKQVPSMIIISCLGYVVSYFSSLHFKNSTEFTSALAAAVIGIFANLYSRVYKGLAISAMLPAIFVQVPSGIASQGSLLAGLNDANTIVSSINGTTTTTTGSSNSLTFGFSMIQVAIGISVGLFTSAIIVYPLGKEGTALFTL